VKWILELCMHHITAQVSLICVRVSNLQNLILFSNLLLSASYKFETKPIFYFVLF
jgi:hypothetical protein